MPYVAGQKAVNPNTGETLVFNGEEWLPQSSPMTHTVSGTQVAPEIRHPRQVFMLNKKGEITDVPAALGFMAGIGAGIERLGANLANLVAPSVVSDADVKALKEKNIPLEMLTSGKIGQMVGESAALYPIGGALSGAGRAIGAEVGGAIGPKIAQILSKPTMARNATEGAIQGVVSADPGERTSGALMNAAIGGGVMPVVGKLGSIASTGVEQLGFRNIPAAQRRLALALSRDLPENSPLNAGQYAIEQLQQLGPEGRLLDVGASTRSLADVLATLPGKAKNTMEEMIRERQAGRYERIMGGADTALGRSTGDYSATLAGLEAERRAASEPLYGQLRGVQVQMDDDILGLLRRAGKEALGKSQRLARLAGEDQVGLTKALEETRDAVTNAAIPGKPVSFTSLDHVKQSLYDLETAYKRKGENAEAAAFGNLRRQLTRKLDDLSPKDAAGESIYAQARNAYAGPSQMLDAVTEGRNAFSGDPLELKTYIDGLSKSERDAFQIGAIQALREKAGSGAGQNVLLKAWKEPNTSDRLKMIFGDKVSDFEKTLANEERLKAAESIGRGSQTAPRQAAMGDLDVEPMLEAGQLVTSAATGNPAGVLAGISKQWNRVKLPEKTRNELARMLAASGTDAQTQAAMIDTIMARMAKRSERGARLAGALGATASNE